MSKLIQVGRFTTFALCLFLALALQLQAEPEISATSIRYCGSLRVTSNGWAYYYFDLRNPDNHPANLRITVYPEGQRNKTLFDINLTMPANSRLKARTPITIGTVPKHVATLYADGNVVKTNEMLLELASSSDDFLVFLNDDFELSYGNFAKNEALRARYFVTTCRSSDIPEHFAGFDEAKMVILERPNFAHVNTRQLEAIRDFVSRGGTLLFADPEGLMDAYNNTILRDMIPITPLKLRTIEEVTACRELGGASLKWENGTPFLDSVANHGISTLTQDGYPLIHWGRYGLGMVGVSAINFSDKTVQASPNFDLIWNHLLSFGGTAVLASSTGDQDLSRALDHITGIEIPSAAKIRFFLLGYFVVVAVFMVGGIITRKRIHAWVALSVISILTTVLIFTYANQRASKLSVYSASLLTIHSEGAPHATAEQLASLFLKKEDQVSLTAKSYDQQIRAVQPPPKHYLEEGGMMNWDAVAPPPSQETEADKKKNPNISRGGDETIREPLRISRQNGISSLDNMVIPYQSPRFYATLFPSSAIEAGTTPIVNWERGGPQLQSWTYPKGLDISHAFLVTEHSVYPLNIRHGQVTLVGGPIVEILAESQEIVYLQNYFKRRDMSAPLIALIGQATQDPSGIITEQFDILGREIYLYPVTEDRSGEQAYIPFGRISIRADQRSSRGLWREGQWQPITSMKGDDAKTSVFSAYLPRAYGRLAPEQIRVRFVGDNRGRNIEFAIKLQDRDGKEILPIKQEGDIYTFANLPENLIDPVDGCFAVVLHARTVQAITDFTSAMRMNSWIIREFDVAVEGGLPPETRGKL